MNDSVPTKKDLALKLLMRHRDVAASIFNAVIYDGKPVIRASDLCDRNPVTSYNSGTVLHGLYRDVTKILKKEHAKLCIVSVENQSHIHYCNLAHNFSLSFTYDELFKGFPAGHRLLIDGSAGIILPKGLFRFFLIPIDFPAAYRLYTLFRMNHEAKYILRRIAEKQTDLMRK